MISAFIKKFYERNTPKAVTWILVTVGVLSSVASDAGYLVLIPLGAAAFLSLGRHPLAGLAAAFSGVAGVFGVNFLIAPIDGILTEITNDAIHMLGSDALDYLDLKSLFRDRIEPRPDCRVCSDYGTRHNF